MDTQDFCINRHHYIDEISTWLSKLEVKIKNENAIGMTSHNVVAERIYCDILNVVFNLQLTSANLTAPNERGIDLVDNAKGVVVQVTSKRAKEKLQHTLDMVGQKFSAPIKLIHVIIDNDPTNWHASDFNIPSNIDFDPRTDVYGRKRLIRKIDKLDIEPLQCLYEVCCRHFVPPKCKTILTTDHLMSFLDVFAVIYRRYETILEYCIEYIEHYDEGGKYRLSSINGMLSGQLHYALGYVERKFQKLRMDVMFHDRLWRKLSEAEELHFLIDAQSQNDESRVDVKEVYRLLEAHKQCIRDIVIVFSEELNMDANSIMDKFNWMANQ